MDTITLTAHFDGEQIRLDEPFELSPGAELAVTILPQTQSAQEHEDWLSLSLTGLQNAYGKAEPEYSLDMLKETNPAYDPR